MRINATSRNFEEQFRALNIPHIIWGGFKFYERAEIKSAINYLRLLVNPRDETALLDVINWPRRGIGDGTVQKLRDAAKAAGCTLYEVVMGTTPPLSTKASEGLREFVAAINNLREMHENFSLHDLASSFISTIGLDQMYKDGKEEDTSRLENLYQLEQAIKTYAAENPNAKLSDYLQTVSLVQDTDSENSDAVVISTVHSAKGLEFDTVFIIGLEDGMFPLNRAKQSPAELEEERRLLYVAITRARRNLYLSHAASRFFQGTRLYTRPSGFLADCGLLLLPSYSNDDYYDY